MGRRLAPCAAAALAILFCAGAVPPEQPIAKEGEWTGRLVWSAQSPRCFLWIKAFFPHEKETWPYHGVKIRFNGHWMTSARLTAVPAAFAFPANNHHYARDRARFHADTETWYFRKDSDDILNNGAGAGVPRDVAVSGLTPFLAFDVTDLARPLNEVAILNSLFPLRVVDLRLVGDCGPLVAEEIHRQAPWNPPCEPVPVAAYFMDGVEDVDAFIERAQRAGARPQTLAMAWRAKGLVALSKADRPAAAQAFRQALRLGPPPEWQSETRFFLERLEGKPPRAMFEEDHPWATDRFAMNAAFLPAETVQTSGPQRRPPAVSAFFKHPLPPTARPVEAGDKRTQVWAEYDKEALRLFFRCEGIAPDSVSSVGGGPDAVVYRGECVEVFLLPDFLPPHVLEFNVSPTGGRFDCREVYDGVYDIAWNGEWESRCVLTEDHWTAAYRIPWSTLGRAPQPGDAWGIALMRGARSTADPAPEWQTWPPRQAANFHDIRWMGVLRFDAPAQP